MLRSPLVSRVGCIVASLAFAASASACLSLSDVVGSGFDLCGGIGPVTSMRPTLSKLSVRVGDSLTVSVTQLDAKGKDTVLCTAQTVTWTSEQAEIASVRGVVFGEAMVFGLLPGATVLRATTSSLAANVSVTVVAR
ncbi:MAG: hypothetical protein ABIZ91_02270 [Gemmatimonadaceae bacterium]